MRHSDCWQWCLSHCVLLPFLRTDTHRRRRTKSKSSERVEGSDSTLSNQKGCCVEYNADVHLIQTTTKGAACNTMHVGQTITKGAACTTTPTMLLIPLFGIMGMNDLITLVFKLYLLVITLLLLLLLLTLLLLPCKIAYSTARLLRKRFNF